ncbi:hypothetical protein LSAC_00519 [Levilinea saccharolytica]|nr:hypothetical protein LSAC_00519 [Levilinea saccharolytica]
MGYVRPKNPMPLSPAEKKELLKTYIEFYEEQAKEDISRLNKKIPREVFEQTLDQIGTILLQHSAELSENNDDVKKFLKETPLPSPLDEYLPRDFRVFCLLLNALKQWLSAEQAATDRYLLGGTARKQLRPTSGHCMVTGEKIDEHGELHHPVRDGRPPIYLSKQGHDQVEHLISTTEPEMNSIADTNANANGEQFLAEIMTIKKKYHHSWAQLRKACDFSVGKPVDFTTPQVKATSLTFARRVKDLTGWSPAEILDWMHENGLDLK